MKSLDNCLRYMGTVKEYVDGKILLNMHDMQLNLRAVIFNAEKLVPTDNIKTVIENCQTIINWMAGREYLSIITINNLIHDTFTLLSQELEIHAR